MEFEPDSRICVGRIAGAHGIQGWVRITSYTEEPAGVAAYGPVSDDKGERMFELEIMRMAKAQVVARIPGVTDRNAAEALRGMRLFVPRAVLPAPDVDEFYFDDLTGLSVETTDGATLGAATLTICLWVAGKCRLTGAKSRASARANYSQQSSQTDLFAREMSDNPMRVARNRQQAYTSSHNPNIATLFWTVIPFHHDLRFPDR